MNEKIDEFLSKEQIKISKFEKDIKKIKTLKDAHLKENLMTNYDNLLEIVTIIDEYGQLEKLTFSMTYDEFKKIISNFTGPIKLTFKLLDKHVSMNGKKFNDANSYAIFVSNVIGEKDKYKKFDESRKKVREKINKTGKKLLILPDVGDYYFTRKFVDEPTNNLLTTIDYMLTLLEKKKSLAVNSINIINNFKCLDFNNDYKYSCQLLEEFSRLIKKNVSVVDDSYDKLKLSLIHELKKYNNTSENKVVCVDDYFYSKIGNREDRKKEYKLRKLNNEINVARKKLSSDSKTWADILEDQILIFDDNQLKMFINDPFNYVPSDIYEIGNIVDVVAMELEKKDVDVEIINALKKVKK